jgi:hypothetical protein
MKIRAKATGEIIDISEEGATILIEAGIYEPVDSEPPVLTKMVKPMTARRSSRP